MAKLLLINPSYLGRTRTQAICRANATTSIEHAWMTRGELDNRVSIAQNTVKKKTMDLMRPIGGVDTTRVAALVLVLPYSEHRARLNESTLREWGCTYSTQDPVRITDIIDILKNANITAQPHDEPSWEPREGVFLTLANRHHQWRER